MGKGLNTNQVKTRRRKFGLNLLEENHKLKPGKVFWSQLKSPLIVVLVLAGVVSVIMKEMADAMVIFGAVGLNTVLGFFQEYKAEKSLEALKKMIVPHCRVIRNGKEKEIKTKNLVPGDVVIISMGEKIPADGKLLTATDLAVNEAMLTGEAEPVEKKKNEQVFMATVVMGGKAVMRVGKIGMKSKIGKLAKKLKGIDDQETPLRRKVSRMSKVLTGGIGLICLFVVIEGVVAGKDLWQMIELGIAVAVASIPEGLAVSMTIILALGMNRILRQKGLVRKLLAAETLGSVNIICLDKTGTLTEGKMQVVKMEIEDREEVMRDLIECNPMINLTDKALADWARERVKSNQDECARQKNQEIPFNSRNKYTAVTCCKQDEEVLYVYGAPEVIMKWCRVDKNKVMAKLDKNSQSGNRIIGMARLRAKKPVIEKKFAELKNKNRLTGLEWLGLVSLDDPVRQEVKQALRLAQKAGIEIKVITGDYKNTALKVLESLGLGKNLTRGRIMSGEGLTEERIGETVLFYRTTPEQKTKIVEKLQSQGGVVAMLGDGVNDSLALKTADIGIVVAEASQVAKETADMVLLDSNFSTVLAAIKEGRVIFDNLKKVILYLISGSFSEVILLIGSLMLKLSIPFLPVQILWINMIEDSLPSLSLAMETESPGILQRKPRKKDEALIDKNMLWMIGIIVLVTGLKLLAIYWWLAGIDVGEQTTRTIIFAILGVDSLVFSYACRDIDKNIWQMDILSNKYLNGSVLIGFIMLAAGIYLPLFQDLLETVPLNAGLWLYILIAGGFDLGLIEMMKKIARDKKK